MPFYKILLPVCLLLTACVSTKKTMRAYESPTLKIIPLTEHTFVHVSYLQTDSWGKVACNGLIYVNENEAAIFDTPSNDKDADELLDLVEKKWKKRVKALVVNHFHKDCLGGLAAFHARGIPSYANRLTKQLAEKEGYVVPQNGFDHNYTLTIGKGKVENFFPGEAHTRDNIVSYLPAEQVLFGGCMVKALDANKGYLGDANTAAWSATIEKVKATYPHLKWVIPGHGDAGGTDLLDYTKELFSTEGEERKQLETTIQYYFDGWLTGDTTLVGKAMHSSCKLKLYRDGKFTEINRTDYLSRFKPSPRNPESAGRIKMIDITGNIATAKCELETPKALFTDYFNLIKVGDAWYIVDKVSTREDKK
jgi:metallo-beta-lactamase class B